MTIEYVKIEKLSESNRTKLMEIFNGRDGGYSLTHLTKVEAVNAILQYEGIIGYTNWIISLVHDVDSSIE